MATLSVERFPFRNSFKTSFLYNQERYLAQYEQENLFRCNWVSDGSVLISSNFHSAGTELLNGKYSSFGGIEYTQEGEKYLEDYIQRLIAWAKEREFDRISLKLPCEFYRKQSADLAGILERNGFSILSTETNQYIKISKFSYAGIIKKNEKKRLRKCIDGGFTFKKMSSEQLELAYELIVDTRVRRGFPVSMTLEQLASVYNLFPDRYLLFGVFDDTRLIAASVSIAVDDRVLYNFYHGDSFSHRTFSPVVLLLAGVYEYSQAKGFEYLDLGISSVQGELNRGLFEFKKNCGCESMDKYRLAKDLKV
ncbi:MAG: GNAT family N-acetyltransferase [Bacteroidota bacterium]